MRHYKKPSRFSAYMTRRFKIAPEERRLRQSGLLRTGFPLVTVTIAFVLGKIAPQAHTLAQVLHQL
jgi:hypothetical protein